MTDHARGIAPDRFRSAVAELARRDVPLPEPVTAAVADLDRIEAMRPVEATDLDVRHAYADPDQTTADIDALAQRAATSHRLHTAWAGAQIDAALRGLSALHDEADTLVEALRGQAEAAIAEVEWFARAGSPDVAELMRAGKRKDAGRAATVTTAFAEWDALRALRQQITGRDFPWRAVGTWTDPTHVTTAMTGRKLTGLEYTCEAIRSGGVPYWPTLAQAADAFARVEQATEQADRETARAARAQKQAAF